MLCDEKNFQRHGFTDLTVILCDQCEREFHVGCLRQHMGINLEELPEGELFFSADQPQADSPGDSVFALCFKNRWLLAHAACWPQRRLSMQQKSYNEGYS